MNNGVRSAMVAVGMAGRFPPLRLLGRKTPVISHRGQNDSPWLRNLLKISRPYKILQLGF